MTNRKLASFQDHIQSILKPVNWSPSERDLEALAKAFEEKKPATYNEAAEIFGDFFPEQHFYVFEGIDDSDYRILLSMAIASAKGSGK
nr:hypothetical protein [uncultured Pseudomonas sp.]